MILSNVNYSCDPGTKEDRQHDEAKQKHQEVRVVGPIRHWPTGADVTRKIIPYQMSFAWPNSRPMQFGCPFCWLVPFFEGPGVDSSRVQQSCNNLPCNEYLHSRKRSRQLGDRQQIYIDISWPRLSKKQRRGNKRWTRSKTFVYSSTSLPFPCRSTATL